MAGQPKAPFYVVLGVVILGLIAFAVYRADIFAPEEQGRRSSPASSRSTPRKLGQIAEARDAASVTTVKEYSFRPAERLPGDQGHLGLQAAGGQHGPLRPERLGRLGADHPGQRRLQARQGLEDARRQGVQGRTGADRRPGRDARRLRRRRGPHRLGHARHGAAVRRRLRQGAATAASCRASSSRSTGPTAATASSSARTSRPSPTCAARSSCWPRTRPRSTSP